MRVVDPLTDPLFAGLSTVFPDATPFHGAPWAQTLVRAYGHRPFYHLVETGAPAYRTQEPGTIGDGRWEIGDGRPEAGDRRSKSGVRSSKLDSMEAGTRTPNGRHHGPAASALANAPSPHLREKEEVRRKKEETRWPHIPHLREKEEVRSKKEERKWSPISHLPSPISSLRPSALLPLMEVSSWLTGRRAVALPFSDFCPLLGTAGSTTADRTQCLESIWPRIVELGRQRGWRSIELRGGPRPAPDATPLVSFHGHLLDLSGGESDLFKNLHPSVRRAIRKAQQSELRVESSHALDALHDYYALHRRTRQRHGLPPQPFKFFLGLYDHAIANGNAFISLVRLGVRAIAGAIFLHAGRTAVFKYGASDPAHQSLRANALLFWETIRQLAADGCTALHFGRTDLDHEGLRRFKLGWGTREEPIHYYRFNLRSNAFVASHDRASTRSVAWFGRLPLPVNRLLGAFAYRHLD